MKQRVLILGASGFIGRRLVDALAKTDWAQPVAASRNMQSTLPDLLVEKINLDATDEVALSRAMTGVTAVVNCVAGSADAIVATAKALAATAQHVTPAPRIVNLSSLAAYGSATGLVGESAELRGDLDAYSAAKAAAERSLATHPNVVTLRPGIVYGPGSTLWSDYIGRLILAGVIGDLGSTGQGGCNLVHVDDVIAAIVAAARQPNLEGQIFNLASPTPLTWNEYFALYGRALGLISVPAISPLRLRLELQVLAGLRKLAEIAAGQLPQLKLQPTPPLRPWLIKLCRQHITQDVRSAEAALQIRWTPLQIGLQQSADWFLATRQQ